MKFYIFFQNLNFLSQKSHIPFLNCILVILLSTVRITFCCSTIFGIFLHFTSYWGFWHCFWTSKLIQCLRYIIWKLMKQRFVFWKKFCDSFITWLRSYDFKFSRFFSQFSPFVENSWKKGLNVNMKSLLLRNCRWWKTDSNDVWCKNIIYKRGPVHQTGWI